MFVENNYNSNHNLTRFQEILKHQLNIMFKHWNYLFEDDRVYLLFQTRKVRPEATKAKKKTNVCLFDITYLPIVSLDTWA